MHPLDQPINNLMLADERLFVCKKDDAVYRSNDLRHDVALVGVEDFRHHLSALHLVAWLCMAAVDAAHVGMNGAKLFLIYNRSNVTAMAVVTDDSHACEKPQDCSDRLLRGCLVNAVCLFATMSSDELKIFLKAQDVL